METPHQELRDRSRYLADYPEEQHIHRETASKAGTKRLFSNREARLSDASEDHGEEYYDPTPAEEEMHSEKRYRATDWPLTSMNRADSPPARTPPRRRNAAKLNAPPSRRPSSSQARPSKFVEGSMNDRVSQRPPTTYLDDEDFRERYEREENGDIRGRKMAQPKGLTDHPNASIAGFSRDRSEVSRQSSIFRFGKSLAASFNPSNWKIWSKQQQQQDEETAQQRVLRERREKAESMYQELKKAGHFRDSAFGQSILEQEEKKAARTKHDSGVELSHQRGNSLLSAEMSREEKRMGRVFLEPPQIVNDMESPASNTQGSVRKSAFQFKKKQPSPSNIRKPQQGEDNGSNAPSDSEYRQVRRIPSRKELQKQQKLVKRVSDLEGKLEAARRQLSESLGKPIPSSQPSPRIRRPRFVPGALSSLPSERLLSGYVSSDPGLSDDNEAFSEIGKAVTVDYKKDNKPVMSGARTRDDAIQLEEPLAASPARLRADKVLPAELGNLTHGLVMQSVESEEEFIESNLNVAAAKTHESHQEAQLVDETGNSQQSASSFHVSEEGTRSSSSEEAELSSSKEITPKLEPEPVKRVSKSKKRKSVFDSMGDDGGKYKPDIIDSESDADSQNKKFIIPPKKSKHGGRPRKLQKTTTTTTTIVQGPAIPTEESSFAADIRRISPPQDKHNHRNPATLSKITSSSKSKIPRQGRRRSTSPHLIRPFPGSAYILASDDPYKKRKEATYHTDSGRQGHATVPPVPVPEEGNDIQQQPPPPLPPMPKSIRLPSGEVVIPTQPPQPPHLSRSNAVLLGGSSSSSSRKLVKARPKLVLKRDDEPERKMERRKRRRGGDVVDDDDDDDDENAPPPTWKEVDVELEREQEGENGEFEWPEDVF